MSWLLDNDVFFAAIYGKHANHAVARRWLDRAKPAGWGIAIETYLAAIRLLMNPAVMRSAQLNAVQAIEVVETELAGRYPGRLIFAAHRPDLSLLRTAQGHRQIMDCWLVQIAGDGGLTLATMDIGLSNTWPDTVTRVG